MGLSAEYTCRVGPKQRIPGGIGRSAIPCRIAVFEPHLQRFYLVLLPEEITQEVHPLILKTPVPLIGHAEYRHNAEQQYEHDSQQ